MTTKATRKQVIRQLSRLITQARANAGYAEERGWRAEAEAWTEVSAWLVCHLGAYAASSALLWPDPLPIDLG